MNKAPEIQYGTLLSNVLKILFTKHKRKRKKMAKIGNVVNNNTNVQQPDRMPEDTPSVESFLKKPQNMDQMITLYMEIHISHKVMEARIQKLETRLNKVSTLLFKNIGNTDE